MILLYLSAHVTYFFWSPFHPSLSHWKWAGCSGLFVFGKEIPCLCGAGCPWVFFLTRFLWSAPPTLHSHVSLCTCVSCVVLVDSGGFILEMFPERSSSSNSTYNTLQKFWATPRFYMLYQRMSNRCRDLLNREQTYMKMQNTRQNRHCTILSFIWPSCNFFK